MEWAAEHAGDCSPLAVTPYKECVAAERASDRLQPLSYKEGGRATVMGAIWLMNPDVRLRTSTSRAR